MISQQRQQGVPLIAAATRHLARQRARFHTPGHKGGRFADPAVKRLLGAALRADLTELPGLDQLHAPTGPIAAAEALAAEACGADRTRFLVGGASAGVIAALIAAAGPGDQVILPRHSHRCAVAALVLSGAEPVWLESLVDPDRLVPCGPTPAQLADALSRAPRAKAVFVTYPTYHGLAPDLGTLAALAHGRGLAVVVDEAHGSHFGLHPALPAPALRLGADVCVQSWHKTLPALTGAAVLHLRGPRVPAERVDAALGWIQTSSPSYLKLLSLDGARRAVAFAGERRMRRLLAVAEAARRGLNRIAGVRCWETDRLGPGVAAVDPTKLLFSCAERGWDGWAVQVALHRRGVALELGEGHYALALLTLADRAADVQALVAAVAGLRPRRRRPRPASLPTRLPTPVLPPRAAALAGHEIVPLRAAVGRVAGGTVSVTPPGLPAVCPGERIDADVVEYVLEALARGHAVTGLLAGDPPAVPVCQEGAA